MTDDRLEKVRAEVERRFIEHDSKKNDYASTDHFLRAIEDKDILSYINSMQEEHEFQKAGGDGMRKVINSINTNLSKEPISESLEQAIDTYLATYFGGEKEKQDWPFLKKMAIHFANWQRQKDAEIIFNAKEDGYRLGKATMKQQLMNDAVECDVIGHGTGWLSFGYIPESDYDFNNGDKVKMIIIMEE